MAATGMGCHLGVVKMFWNQIEMLVAQHGECAKSHGIVPIKRLIYVS